MIDNEITKLSEIVQESNRIVFFGGAGVSTESGIPDFRSVDGLYHQKYSHPPEEILSHTYFMNHTKEFYDFYRDKMIYPEAKPNPAHLKIAEWEKEGKVSAVITQNIDGLHQRAGSHRVLELHGSVMRNYCQKCGAFYPLEKITESQGVPHCDQPGCDGVVKPDVVLYEEPLNEKVMHRAMEALTKADTLIIGGTSMQVYPAAGLVRYFYGKNLVVINKSQLDLDSSADLVIRQGIGEVFSELS